ncbi:(2Fe-2S)-binding protein [Rhizobium sp. AG855]|uniref:(2Fe-2S)-binding protein n=1 Tax=Rhizobium sp. AG855 TaxID=2183898 RepID=UPI000FF61AF2|nr:BFD-like [2Fe-2S] binding protein [Rhizobium sp. AG855]
MSCLTVSDPMLVCSCNYITDKDIKAVIHELLDEDCWQLIVPGKVYHAMGKRGRCCGCFPNVVDLIIKTTAEYHAARKTEETEVVNFMERLKQFHEEQKAALAERRQTMLAARRAG